MLHGQQVLSNLTMRRLKQVLSNYFTKNTDLPCLNAVNGKMFVSSGIRRQKTVCRILHHKGWLPTSISGHASAFAGWGRKKSGLDTLILAESYRKPFYGLEDGFLRSVGIGQNGEPPLSIIMDGTGIYYDATAPSWLENRLNCKDALLNLNVQDCRDNIALLQQSGHSKYNHFSRHNNTFIDKGNYVLIIDQTRNDPSISYGMANALTFEIMLEKAKYENPSKRILIKSHPAVIAGAAQGHFDLADKSVDFILSEINPWQLLEGADKVYTVSSGMGMEALIAGKTVHCFGMPFYAGWGLTNDELKIDRRTSSVSIENLFSAAYLEYPTYYDPYLDKITTFERVVELLSFMRKQNDLNRQKTICVGMSKWKQPSVAAFLRSTSQEPEFYKSREKALRKATKQDARIVIWASKSTRVYEDNCKKQNVSLVKMEDGFLRSNGLGSDLIPPLSLVLDRTGIYYDPTQMSDLEKFIEEGNFSQTVMHAVKSIKLNIINAGLTKYNVGNSERINRLPPKGQRKIILVPGQVADDQSIRMGTLGSNVCTNIDLLKRTREDNPDAFIIYKPHPDVEAGNRHGWISPHKLLEFADYIASDVSTNYALSVCDEVWTLTSLIGFEALLRDKVVVCFGLPFYAGWGLTRDHIKCSRRTRSATLDEVFAAAYIQYSSYIFLGLNGYMRMPPDLAPEILTRKNKSLGTLR